MIQVPAFVSTGAGCSRHEVISKHPGVITRGQRKGNDAMQGLWGKCLGKRPTAFIPYSPSPAHTEAPSLDPPSGVFPWRILPLRSPPEAPPLAPPLCFFFPRRILQKPCSLEPPTPSIISPEGTVRLPPVPSGTLAPPYILDSRDSETVIYHSGASQPGAPDMLDQTVPCGAYLGSGVLVTGWDSRC